jgi:hypothetical protein
MMEISDSKTKFAKHGYVHFTDLIPASLIQYLKRIIDNAEKEGGYGEIFFRKNCYNFAIDDAKIASLVNSKALQERLQQTIDRPLIHSDSIVFELDQKKKGFPWHVGLVSFKFIYPEDGGYSLWIPLDRIDNQDQGGGMALISLSDKNGGYLYNIAQEMNERKLNKSLRFDSIVTKILKRCPYVFVRILMLFFPFFSRFNPLALSPEDNRFLNSVKEEPNLEVGDAILFDKNVFHQTIPLRKGELHKRQALVLRFIDADSRYNEIGDSMEENVQFQIVDRIKIGSGQKFAQEQVLDLE